MIGLYSDVPLSMDVKGLWSYYLAGKMSTPIVRMGRVEHHLDPPPLGDMKGMLNYLVGKMSTLIVWVENLLVCPIHLHNFPQFANFYQ